MSERSQIQKDTCYVTASREVQEQTTCVLEIRTVVASGWGSFLDGGMEGRLISKGDVGNFHRH